MSTDPSTWFSARDQGGRDFGVRLSQLFGSNAITTLQGGYHRDKNALTAPDGIRTEDWTCPGGTPTNPCVPPDEPTSITGGYGMISGLADHSESSRRQIRGDATYYEGSHELKGGRRLQRGADRGDRVLHGRPVGRVRNEVGQLYYVHTFNAVGPDDPTPLAQIVRNATVKDFGGFLQDSWRAVPGLTVNARRAVGWRAGPELLGAPCCACRRGSLASA